MKVQLLVDGTLRSVMLEPGEREGVFRGEVDGQPVEMEATVVAPGVVSLLMRSGPMAGRSFRCVFTRDAEADGGANGKSVQVGQSVFGYQLHDPRSLNTRKKRSGEGEGPLLIKASMAGRVVRLLAEVGSEIEAHAGVIIIEAMKMQNELRASRAGRVVEIRVGAGEMVSSGQILAVIE